MLNQTLSDALHGWRSDDLGNLWFLLDDDRPLTAPDPVGQIEGRIEDLYHPRVRREMKAAAKKAEAAVIGRLRRTEPNRLSGTGSTATSYSDLLTACTRKLKVCDPDADIDEQLLFLSHEVAVRALRKMTPRQRIRFFEKTVDADEVCHQARIPSRNLSGPLQAFAVLGAAQASGFGVYLAATTALDFLTHAVGVTLPFAAYTGLSSTIAVLIGAPGWLAAGVWTGWKLTEPDWNRLIPAVLYIGATNVRRRLSGSEI